MCLQTLSGLYFINIYVIRHLFSPLKTDLPKAQHESRVARNSFSCPEVLVNQLSDLPQEKRERKSRFLPSTLRVKAFVPQTCCEFQSAAAASAAGCVQKLTGLDGTGGDDPCSRLKPVAQKPLLRKSAAWMISSA